jgi:hypothetical protein
MLIALGTQEVQIKQQIEALRLKRDELAVQFEFDGDDVLVYGVAASPLRASKDAWMNFLEVEGARKLREFIVTRKNKAI